VRLEIVGIIALRECGADATHGRGVDIEIEWFALFWVLYNARELGGLPVRF
tara:strand:+ start:1772 stop:1924 length:153 start_codon:yes stop_codon:yes gene_type:complete